MLNRGGGCDLLLSSFERKMMMCLVKQIMCEFVQKGRCTVTGGLYRGWVARRAYWQAL